MLLENLEADIPEAMFVTETENQVRDYDSRLRMQGLDLNTYFKYTGQTLDSLREQLRPMAEKQVKTRLALEKIAELENVTVTEEEIEAELQKIADAYRIDIADVKAQITPDMIEGDIKVSKAAEVLKANASITKPRKPRAKKAKEETPSEEVTEEATEE
jgi:trigger factor